VLRGRRGGRRRRTREGTRLTGRPNLLAGEDVPPAPNQKRSRDKRERLKAAALALFGRKGYERASIEDIARRANLAVGGFYRHFRSKRQLLLSLMDELLEKLSEVDLRPQPGGNVRDALRRALSRSFAHDLRYLGAYRAWQEAVLSDHDLAKKQIEIHAWTGARVEGVFRALARLPRARPDVDVPGLARVMDSFFWSLLGRAAEMKPAELDRWLESATHLIFHAIFRDGKAAAQR
jgi:AcrR family transcriptional regulator